jgi:hypothetical protein
MGNREDKVVANPKLDSLTSVSLREAADKPSSELLPTSSTKSPFCKLRKQMIEFSVATVEGSSVNCSTRDTYLTAS